MYNSIFKALNIGLCYRFLQITHIFSA